MKRRLKVTITRIQRKRGAVRVPAPRLFCLICNEKVETLSVGEAFKLLPVNEKMFSHLITAEKIHLVSDHGGDSRICQNSLRANNFEIF